MPYGESIIYASIYNPPVRDSCLFCVYLNIRTATIYMQHSIVSNGAELEEPLKGHLNWCG